MKKTIIVSKVINKTREAYVQNYSIDELKIFQRLKKEGIELKEDTFSDNELYLFLNNCTKDYNIEGVFDIDNSYNRDQKEINKIKDNIEKVLEAKGFTIITHTEPAEIFNLDDIKKFIKTRNYLLQLQDNINESQKKLDKLNKDIEYKENKLEDVNTKLNNTINRYNKGKKYLEEIEDKINKLPNNIKQLENDYNIKLESYNKLNNNVNCLLSEIYKYTNILENKKQEVKKIDSEISQLNDKLKFTKNEVEYKNPFEQTNIEMWRDFLYEYKGISIRSLRTNIDKIKKILDNE